MFIQTVFKYKQTAKIKKYAKIHGPNDFELTDTPQSTLYITDEFLKTVKKGDIFKITNKIFIIIALLISSIFVSAIKAASDLQYYRKEKEFLQCMGIHEKIWKKIFDVEIQILSWISLITATILSAAYMIMNIHIESERGVIYGYKIWIYWLVILCLYWFMHYILQRIVTRYARKNVETKMNVLQVENLIRSYRKSVIKESEEDVKVLKGISFQVAEGEFVGIMGKSGCGKTTLLKTLGMIDKPTDGTIKFMGEDTSELYGDKLADIRNSKIGFIFQDFYLMDSLSVEENIMLPMIISKQNINKMIVEAKKYAEQFQIEHLLKKNPYELSGGEKQRVAICRALINNPDLILADEPTGNLDSKSGKIVIDALNKISSEYKKTIVMVTHDPQMASYCSRLILLKDGVILEDLKNSGNQDAFYQEILGKMKEL